MGFAELMRQTRYMEQSVRQREPAGPLGTGRVDKVYKAAEDRQGLVHALSCSKGSGRLGVRSFDWTPPRAPMPPSHSEEQCWGLPTPLKPVFPEGVLGLGRPLQPGSLKAAALKPGARQLGDPRTLKLMEQFKSPWLREVEETHVRGYHSVGPQGEGGCGRRPEFCPDAETGDRQKDQGQRLCLQV